MDRGDGESRLAYYASLGNEGFKKSIYQAAFE